MPLLTPPQNATDIDDCDYAESMLQHIQGLMQVNDTCVATKLCEVGTFTWDDPKDDFGNVRRDPIQKSDLESWSGNFKIKGKEYFLVRMTPAYIMEVATSSRGRRGHRFVKSPDRVVVRALGTDDFSLVTGDLSLPEAQKVFDTVGDGWTKEECILLLGFRYD